MPVQPGTVNAPEFPEGLEWLNSDRPLRLAELRGKIVLLDFWTYCCINCMHVLPDLKRLEEKHADYLVVIGVHSAKFIAERETDNIRQAVLRYGIEHPVVNDHQMRVWQEYAARAWPSLVLIDPRGKVYGSHSGEGVFEVFDGVITEMAGRFEARGELLRGAVELRLEKDAEPAALLSFPGKVLADGDSDRLFIADSNHHRIVVASMTTGALLEIVGAGEAGLADGDFSEARFRNPQGMALEGDLLYVADTDNHAIRRVDLRARAVITLAGTGQQDVALENLPGPARGRRLNSPWDLDLAHGVLFIAMAGAHQIWGMDLEGGYLAGHAGSGREDHLDGPLLGAAMAQPSGLTQDNDHLFVADSEISAIRAVSLDPRGGHVRTVMGAGLFDYGDIDGAPDMARMQHPLDVEYVEGRLYVADTYNNKIKAIGLSTRTTRTFSGSGQAGLVDGSADAARFDEPAGLSASNGKLYVADTNNHSIRVVDLDDGSVSTFELAEPHRLARPRKGVTRLDAVSVRPGRAKLVIEIELPANAKLNRGADSQVGVVSDGELQVMAYDGAPVEAAIESPSTIRIETAVYYCQAGRESLCHYEMATYELAIEADEQAGERAAIRLGRSR